jgi:TFIIF-interacting CTD phosphatase-like protein
MNFLKKLFKRGKIPQSIESPINVSSGKLGNFNFNKESPSKSINVLYDQSNPSTNTFSEISSNSNNDNPNTLLRTIIDNESNHEDIFSNLSQIANSSLPDQQGEYKGRISLFIPLDEVLLFSYIPDENLGMHEFPKYKEYDYRIELTDYKTFAFLYYRDYLAEFLNYIDDNFEPILYTTGDQLYVDKIMNLIDPNKIFPYRLYNKDCHLFKNSGQNAVEYLKDINLFTNRSIKKKILIEFSPLNYVISPDNSKLFINLF